VHPPRPTVDADAVEDEDVPGHRAGTSREGVDPREELVERERLHEVVVGAAAQPAHAIVDGVASGEHEDGRLDAAVSQRSREPHPVELGQHHVHDREVQVAGDGALEPGPAVATDVDGVSVGAEAPRDQLGEAVVVLDQKDVHRVIVAGDSPVSEILTGS
jgi:hypothetical protein